jgi:hypothetical protein
MKSFEELNSKNFMLFAAKSYDNPQCMTEEEFQEDLQRFKYLKRLFNRYEVSGELSERLILNHLIVLYNVFGIREANHMMFYKIEEKNWSVLKTFLVYLNYLPEDQYIEVPLDPLVVEALRKI